MPYDENVVYTFHCYEPLAFTHQGAHWMPEMDTEFRISIDASYREMSEMSEKNLPQITVGFEGFDPDKSLETAYFDTLFADAVRIAEERNVSLYCGEYGVIDRADAEEALRWYEMIREAFDKYRIGRAAWTYKEKDFGFIDDPRNTVLDRIVKQL